MAKVFTNITNATHNSVSLTEVQSIEISDTVTSNMARGDGDIWPDLGYVQSADLITVTVELENLSVSTAIGDDADLTFTTVGKGSGANIAITCANAVCTGREITANHAEKDTMTLTFECYSSGGATSPISQT